MSNTSAEELFRQAAEAEGGMAVSAGAGAANTRFSVDLAPVPESKRAALVAQIRELILRASEPDRRDEARAALSQVSR